jgi:hypothetical protein
MTRKQRRVFWPAVTVALLTATTVAFVSPRNKKPPAPVPLRAETPIAQRKTPEFKQQIRVWLFLDEIRPKVIRAWPGKALVTVENEAHANVSLQIAKVVAGRTVSVGAVDASAKSKRLDGEVVLVPGEYVLFEASRPQFRTSLIVEPRR